MSPAPIEHDLKALKNDHYLEQSISLSPIVVQERRRVYSLLNYLGDIGGLWCSLLIIFSISRIITGSNYYYASLVKSIYKFNLDRSLPDVQVLKTQKLQQGFCVTLKSQCCSYFLTRDLRIQRLLHKGQRNAERMLDVQKMIRDQHILQTLLNMIMPDKKHRNLF